MGRDVSITVGKSVKRESNSSPVMVGHTGVFSAAVKAVETVDECVGKVVNATLKMGGIAMITADHGNAEQMEQPDGSPMAAIGLNSNLVKLVRTGGKPIVLGACCWAGITAVSLLMQHMLGIW